MADKTGIEWTATYLPDGTVIRGATWNPLVAYDRETGKRGWFCTKVSAGCAHCYAEPINIRLGNGHLYRVGDLSKVEFKLAGLDKPLRWKRGRKIFVNSMTDLFHEAVPDALIDLVFAVMALAPQHTMQVLTKRPARAAEYLNALGVRERIARAMEALADSWASPCMGHLVDEVEFEDRWPLPNLWLGTSVEHQAAADERVPHLLRCPAAVRFLSCEPLLGEVGVMRYMVPAMHVSQGVPPDQRKPLSDESVRALNHLGRAAARMHGIPLVDWVICGGESGRAARPMHPDWARSLRDQCAAAGVPFFFKQWGEWSPQKPKSFGQLSRNRYSHPTHAWSDPSTVYNPVRPPADHFPRTIVYRVGKHAAGRLLDGVEHNAFPVEAPHAA